MMAAFGLGPLDAKSLASGYEFGTGDIKMEGSKKQCS